jgi:tRNA (guanine6-N2)-methyltransferase
MRRRPYPPAPPAPAPARATIPSQIECDLPAGLEELALDELARLSQASDVRAADGVLRCAWRGGLRPLLALRSVTAAYQRLTFDVPRPKALLGHQHFTQLVGAAREALALHPAGSFATLRLSAAGDDSSVMLRLRDELAGALGLSPGEEEADLLVRIRRAGHGWEALVRISPRPLATRSWRVRNFPGAPSATLAYALAALSEPRPADRMLNICCGSGTILAERLLLGPAQLAIGCDIDPEALACARANLAAAGVLARAQLEMWDATALPLEAGSVDCIVADLPFGRLIGTHAQNERLYPRILTEAARVAAPGARMLLLTHELRLLEQAAGRADSPWRPVDLLRVRSGGMTPGIFLFERD